MKPFLPSFPVSPIVRVLAILGFFIGCLAGPGARGQGHHHGGWCGTPAPSIESKRAFVEMIKQAEQEISQQKSTVPTKYIPISVWIFRNAAGERSMTRNQINQILARANRDFLPIKTQFFISNISDCSVDNSLYNMALTEVNTDQIRNLCRSGTSINLYIPKTINGGLSTRT